MIGTHLTGDRVLRLQLMQGQARVLFLETTAMTQRCADLHNATPVCAAALGRLMTGTAMLGVMLKGEKESVTVSIHGDGPMGTLIAVADHAGVKACADNPQIDLPLREDGKLDVGSAVGHHGRLTVVKDLGLREPYIGQSELVSGEIAMDFANYFVLSEQQPSLVALGVLTHGPAVLKAGGLLIQPLPGCSEETLSQLELRSPMFADISRELSAAPMEELLEGWFRGLDPELLEEAPIAWQCNCSRDRMERALISLGRKELQQLIDEDKGASLACHFCHSHYDFSTEDLKRLFERATRA